jgi:predicted nucleic acid-binding protein
MARSVRNVIADATVLIFIDQLHLMGLLRKLYGHLLVPAIVRDEVDHGRRRGQPGPDLARLSWVEVRRSHLDAQVKRLGLDQGESAVLSLALSIGRRETFVLMDDRKGRRAAASLGIDHTGILGILIEAKRAKLIPLVKPYVDQLVVAGGFWVAPATLRTALRLAGE